MAVFVEAVRQPPERAGEASRRIHRTPSECAATEEEFVEAVGSSGSVSRSLSGSSADTKEGGVALLFAVADHGVMYGANAAATAPRRSTGGHYTARGDARMHDVLLCIGTGKFYNDPKRMRFTGEEFYAKPVEEMAQLFPDHPEATAEYGSATPPRRRSLSTSRSSR